MTDLPSLAPDSGSLAALLAPVEVLHISAHAGGTCPHPPKSVCPVLVEAEDIVLDLLRGGYSIVPTEQGESRG